ncbi:MAG: DUF3857 domain-containing protein, partial [Bacteroidota bacterium]
MKAHRRSIVILALGFFLCGAALQAQPQKFGKIAPEDFIVTYDDMSNMPDAEVLFDKGVVYFGADFDGYIDRHVRIRINNKAGFDFGEVELLYNDRLDQDIKNLKASVFNLESGKVRTKKLSKKEFFKEDINNGVKGISFTFPEMQEGSIIEYSYKMKFNSPFELPDWRFHTTIPVKWSEFEVNIPEYFQYQMSLKGTRELDINEGTAYSDRFGNGYKTRMVMKDLEAIKSVPYITSTLDYRSEIVCQLSTIQIPGRRSETFFKEWSGIAEDLRKVDSFWGEIKAARLMKTEITGVLNDSLSGEEQIQAIASFVATEMEWDGRHRLFAGKGGVKDAYKKREGNSAEINFLLIGALRAAGFEAHPGVLSTRKHGKVMMNNPVLHQLNHILAVVELSDGTLIPIDATEGDRSIRNLASKNLYRNVFVVKDKFSDWVLTQPLESTRTITNAQVELEEGKALLKTDFTFFGQAKERALSTIRETSLEAFVKDELLNPANLTIDTVSSNMKEKGKFLKISFSGSRPLETSGDNVYLNPSEHLKIHKNPFIDETRNIPVDFPYTFKDKIILTVQSGPYTPVENPENVYVIADEERKASYKFVFKCVRKIYRDIPCFIDKWIF